MDEANGHGFFENPANKKRAWVQARFGKREEAWIA
jgi:hypothetical protein